MCPLPQIKGIENWVSASGIIQMEAPVFCRSRRTGLWNEKILCRECRRVIDLLGHWLFWCIRRLLHLSKIEVSDDLALMHQTNNTSVVPLRVHDPKEIRKGFPLYFGPIPFKTKASHRSDEKGIWQDLKRLLLFSVFYASNLYCLMCQTLNL